MSDGFIQVPADSVGKKVATQEITRPDANVYERQEMIVAGYNGTTVQELLSQLIIEVRDLKMALLQALH